MKSPAATWLRFSPKRATTPAAIGSVLSGHPRRRARSATGSTSRNARKPRKWASACSKTKRVTSAAASRKFPKPTSSNSFPITAFPKWRISTPPSVSENIPPARSLRAFSGNRKNPRKPKPVTPSPPSSRPSSACWASARRPWSSRATTICSFTAPSVAIPFPATKLSATSPAAAAWPCTPELVPTCRISCTRPNAASPSSGAAVPKPSFPSSSPSARATAPAFLPKSPPSSAEPVPTFTTWKADPIAPTPALTPILKLPTSDSSKPFSSISAKSPAFWASNASTSPATKMLQVRASHHAVFSAAEIFFRPWAFRPVAPTCPFAGYLAQHTSYPSRLLPIQWRYAVQTYFPRCVRPLPDKRVPPASAHGLSSPRPGGDVVQQRRATQNLEHLRCGSRATRKVEASGDQLDIISGDAVMLRLVGLSDSAVDLILHRRLKGQPTMSSAEIGRLKNTGLTEKQILERIHQGMTDAQADKEAAFREATRNHANTGFVRTHGRRSR